jgi:branched-chain amino acid aminotransferase
MNESIFYVNGKFVPQSQASISVGDMGLLRSYGVFDFTITYNRIPFRLDDHLRRLQNSARMIELELPWSIEDLKELTFKTMDKNLEGEKSIRIVVTGGVGPDAFTPAKEPTIVIIVKPLQYYSREFFTDGIKTITYEANRAMPEAKTLNYIYAMRALKKAQQQGAETAIYKFNGNLLECTVESFFAVKDAKLITAETQILDGITRKTILELVKDKIPVEYRFVKVSEIPKLDEAFLTSSNHEVMPIVTIDKTKIGNGKPGPITKEIMKLFGAYTGRNLFD